MVRGACCAIVVVVATTADAQPQEPIARETVELRYTAPEECPARDAVLAQISQRTPAVTFGTGARRLFEITIATSEHGYSGTLVVDHAADKQLAASRCDDLVTALALVTAIAIDPSASLAPLPPPEKPAPRPIVTIATESRWRTPEEARTGTR